MERIENKKARQNYTVIDTIEAGIELTGAEVKSVRAHRASLVGSHVDVAGTSARLIDMHIDPYQPNNRPESYAPKRPRQLLLKKSEIVELGRRRKEAGLTIVPLAVYNKGRLIKVSLGLVRGKKQHDKRESLKKKAAKRDIERTLKNR